MTPSEKQLPHWADKCFKSIDNRFWYYLIPKNASISFRSIGLFESNVWYPTEQMPPDAVTILILRDPFERLISAYQWDCKNPFEDLGGVIYSFEMYLQRLTKGLFTHTSVPQIDYIRSRNIVLEQVTEIMTVENLPVQFEKFKNKYGLSSCALRFSNTSDLHAKNALRAKLLEPDNRQIFERLYKEDIDLYNLYKKQI